MAYQWNTYCARLTGFIFILERINNLQSPPLLGNSPNTALSFKGSYMVLDGIGGFKGEFLLDFRNSGGISSFFSMSLDEFKDCLLALRQLNFFDHSRHSVNPNNSFILYFYTVVKKKASRDEVNDFIQE
jgi:hypothetical protein